MAVMASCVIIFTLVLLQAFIYSDGLKCGDWTSWSHCTVSCGGGQQARAAPCVRKNNNQDSNITSLLTTNNETRPCNTQPCDKTCGEWSGWSACTRKCGLSAKKQRVRQCTQHTGCCRCDPVHEIEIDIVDCPFKQCKIDCTGPDCKWVTGARGYQYDPLDCTAYYTCLRLGDTLQILYEHCPRGTVWNVDMSYCDYDLSEGTQCVMPPTPTLGTPPPLITDAPCIYKRNPREYGGYILKKGGAAHEKWQCPAGHIFSADICRCGPDPLMQMDDPDTIETDCGCMTFGFERSANGDGCNKAYAEVVGNLPYMNGHEGKAGNFNGKTRTIVEMFKHWLGSSPDGHLTVSLWVRLPCKRPKAYHGLLVNTDCTTSPSLDVHLESGTVHAGVVTEGSNNTMCIVTSPSPISCNKWTQITMVYNDDGLNLYINCELVSTTACTGRVLNRPMSLIMGHGGKDDNQFLKGGLDEVVICKHATGMRQICGNEEGDIIQP